MTAPRDPEKRRAYYDKRYAKRRGTAVWAASQRRYRAKHRDALLRKAAAKRLEDPDARRRYNERAAVKRSGLRSISAFWIAAYLAEHPCVDCGEADIAVLEFDHVRGEKLFGIGRGGKNHGLDIIKDEVAKCEVRCCNCHRRVTQKRSGSWRYGIRLDGLSGGPKNRPPTPSTAA